MTRLHLHSQPNCPVAVFVDGTPAEQGAIAMTMRAGPGWQIHLRDDLHGRFLLDVLIHEWAHTLSWGTGNDLESDCGGHGWEWGIEYSRAFRCAIYDIDVPDDLPRLQATIAGSSACEPVQPSQGTPPCR